MRLKPTKDNIIIEPILLEDKTESGILLPETINKEQAGKGRVIEIGLEVNKNLKGKNVFFIKYGPNEIKVDNKNYLIAKEEDILAIYDDTKKDS